MNSWEILKAELTKTSQPGTMGRAVDLNRCGLVFVCLRDKLTDYAEAEEAMNADEEVREAIKLYPTIEELRNFGLWI